MRAHSPGTEMSATALRVKRVPSVASARSSVAKSSMRHATDAGNATSKCVKMRDTPKHGASMAVTPIGT